MQRKKKLEELTLKDNFMFGAVMSDEKNCRDFLEMTLGFPIEKVAVSREKSMVYHPGYRGVRLDIYARDANHTRYNVEMQAVRKSALGRRARYYHGQIDMETLRSGMAYAEIPDTYVIFICDFDPFGQEKYCYTFKTCCLECQGLDMQDGSRSIFLSTCGKNENEVSKKLVNFLRFLKADIEECKEDFGDEFVRQLQKSVRNIKESREMEEKFMIFEEMLQDERAEGKAEGKAEDILELLEELGAVPDDLRVRIMSERDLAVLKGWHKKAARADSIQQFLRSME